MIHGFERLQPFRIATEEVSVEIQPALTGMNPWIPARSFKIEEIWDESQTYRVGDPLNRLFKMSAEGVKSSQLPSLQDQQLNDSNFKIYADKPELEDETKEGSIRSLRREQYTLIPQHPGPVTLPEITVAWWDVTKKEKAFAKIPARTLQILPAVDHERAGIADSLSDSFKESFLPLVTHHEEEIKRDPLLYVLDWASCFYLHFSGVSYFKRKLLVLQKNKL